jgi:hypothetical protein
MMSISIQSLRGFTACQPSKAFLDKGYKSLSFHCP